MSGDFVTRGQVVMLAETLYVAPSQIEPLAHLGADALRELRERISAVLFDELNDVFSRVSALGPLVPAAVVAKAAQRAIPPLVAGRAGGALGMDHPVKGAAVLRHLSPEYMADAAPYLDPRTVEALAPRMPVEPLIAAANVLLQRREYITAARFVDFATPELVRAFEPGIQDDEGALMTAAYVASAERLEEIIDTIPPHRLENMAEIAKTVSDEALLAGISVAGRLRPEVTAKLAAMLFDGLDADGAGELVRMVLDAGVIGDLLAIAGSLDVDALNMLATQFGSTLQALDPEAAVAMVHSVVESGHLGELLGLGRHLEPHAVEILAERVGETLQNLDQAAIEDIVREIVDPTRGGGRSVVADLLALAGSLTPEAISVITRSPLLEQPEIIEAFVRAASSSDELRGVLRLGERLPPEVRKLAARVLADQRDEALVGLARTAAAQGLGDALQRLLAEQPEKVRRRFDTIVSQLEPAERAALDAG